MQKRFNEKSYLYAGTYTHTHTHTKSGSNKSDSNANLDRKMREVQSSFISALRSHTGKTSQAAKSETLI